MPRVGWQDPHKMPTHLYLVRFESAAAMLAPLNLAGWTPLSVISDHSPLDLIPVVWVLVRVNARQMAAFQKEYPSIIVRAGEER